MTNGELEVLLNELLKFPAETEWLEFKCNNKKHESIGEYLSAIANSATLHHKGKGFLVWGIDDKTRHVVGTTFNPRQEKIGNEELEHWLGKLLFPRLDFRIHQFQDQGYPMVLFEVPAATHTPVRFRETEYIRVGTNKKKLKDYPEKERALWGLFSRQSFEQGIAVETLSPDEVLSLIDYPSFFELLGQSVPEGRSGILERLCREKVIIKKPAGIYSVTNLGAILFARRLDRFEGLARKAIRVIFYDGNNRIKTIREQTGSRGYAAGFEGLIEYINSQLPRNEEMGQALRKEVRLYPEIAVRELVANALIHQDFSITGTSPMVEVFSDRIEITNPGIPLIDTLRFIDEPPQSRNETLAALMRRLRICEERGSGIDKVIFEVELFQLPAPDFQVSSNHTKAILYAPKNLSAMDQNDRIRACYQHACLCWVSNKPMSNTSLRKRFGIADKNSAMASRIIAETVKASLIKLADSESKSKKHARYLPFWL